MLTYALFVIGFPFLIKGADFLVDGASALAKRWGVSELTIGLTVVAFGTSAPELVVNIYASIEGTTEIAIGNVLGSNIANIFLILGISAVVRRIIVTQDMVWKQIPLSLLSVVVLGFLVNDIHIDDAGKSDLSRIDGLILLSFFAVFMYYVFGLARKERSIPAGDRAAFVMSYSKAGLLVCLGLVGLIFGAQWIVDGAVKIAGAAGMSERFVGLTIVAVGTSLPELATSVTAAVKGSTDIAVGNIVGSNIFNIFLILGLGSIIRPFPFEGSGSNIDVAVTAAASGFLFLAMFTGKKPYLLERWEGIAFVAAYVGYVTYVIVRG